MTQQKTEIRIYVACLASYNGGILYGRWIDAREHRFRWIEVPVECDGDVAIVIMCTEYNNPDYQPNKCVYPYIYDDLVGQYYGSTISRNDILPTKNI